MAEGAVDKFSAHLKEINDLLALEFGSKARIQPLHVPETSLASDVISNAKLLVPDDFYSVWVSHSLPEVATYQSRGLPFSIICHSQDHLYHYGQLRWLFDPTMRDVAHRNCPYILYKIIDEFALKYSDPDKAVLMYTKAFDGNSIRRPDLLRYATIAPFEDSTSINEFICLLNHLHEMGHSQSEQQRFDNVSPGHILAKASLLKLIHDGLYPSLYPDAVKEQALQLANVPQGGYGFSLTNLKKEIIADFFAAESFFRYLQLKCHSRSKETNPELGSLLLEYAIYPFLVGLIQRCKFNAQSLDSKESLSEKLLRSDLQEIAISLRTLALIHLQHRNLHRIASSQYTGKAHQDLMSDLLNHVQIHINPTAVTINSEMRKVRNYCIQRHEWSNESQELESRWQQMLKGDVLACIELEEFCRLAESLHKDSRLLQGLKSVLVPIRAALSLDSDFPIY